MSSAPRFSLDISQSSDIVSFKPKRLPVVKEAPKDSYAPESAIVSPVSPSTPQPVEPPVTDSASSQPLPSASPSTSGPLPAFLPPAAVSPVNAEKASS